MSLRFFAVLTAVLLSPLTALAHFPFLHLKTDEGHAALHVYFAESAEPDDPQYLDALLDSKTWQIRGDGEVQPLKLTKGKDSLIAKPSGAKTAAFGLTQDYGVMSRGDASFRLAYYGKTYSGQDAWSIDTGKQLDLDIVPERKGDDLVLKVLWKGKPLPNAEVVVQGGIESYEGKTDAEGRYRCSLPDPELYSIRAKHVEEQAGELDGKKFDSVRHYSTLTLDLK